jgi:hypothetical protein
MTRNIFLLTFHLIFDAVAEAVEFIDSQSTEDTK